MTKVTLWIVLACLAAVSGCNYLRMYPTYSEVMVQNRDRVQIIDEGSKFFKEWILTPSKYKFLQEEKMRIGEYIQAHPQLADKHKAFLQDWTLAVGMTTEDVEALLGKPSVMKHKKKDQVIWIYKEKDQPWKFYWFSDWVKLYFQADVLVNIETKHVSIPDRQPTDYYIGVVQRQP